MFYIVVYPVIEDCSLKMKIKKIRKAHILSETTLVKTSLKITVRTGFETRLITKCNKLCTKII